MPIWNETIQLRTACRCFWMDLLFCKWMKLCVGTWALDSHIQHAVKRQKRWHNTPVNGTVLILFCWKRYEASGSIWFKRVDNLSRHSTHTHTNTFTIVFHSCKFAQVILMSRISIKSCLWFVSSQKITTQLPLDSLSIIDVSVRQIDSAFAILYANQQWTCDDDDDDGMRCNSVFRRWRYLNNCRLSIVAHSSIHLCFSLSLCIFLFLSFAHSHLNLLSFLFSHSFLPFYYYHTYAQIRNAKPTHILFSNVEANVWNGW